MKRYYGKQKPVEKFRQLEKSMSMWYWVFYLASIVL